MSGLSNLYHYVQDNVDKRTASWPLVSSMSGVLFIYAFYFLFIFYIGPRYMKNRQPYSLKRFIQCFDIFQIVANVYIVYLILDAGWYQNIWIYCIPPNYSTNPDAMQIAWSLWLTMMLKFIDLIETAIYVLRKKNNQITTLHLYHHISTSLITWGGVRYIAVEMTCMLPLVNCSIHVVMYTYYFLMTLGPEVQKKILPYKSLLTLTQMVQFVVLLIFCSTTLTPSCPVTKIPAPLMIVNLVINLVMFYDFYQKSYVNKKPKKK